MKGDSVLKLGEAQLQSTINQTDHGMAMQEKRQRQKKGCLLAVFSFEDRRFQIAALLSKTARDNRVVVGLRDTVDRPKTIRFRLFKPF